MQFTIQNHCSYKKKENKELKPFGSPPRRKKITTKKYIRRDLYINNNFAFGFFLIPDTWVFSHN